MLAAEVLVITTSIRCCSSDDPRNEQRGICNSEGIGCPRAEAEEEEELRGFLPGPTYPANDVLMVGEVSLAGLAAVDLAAVEVGVVGQTHGGESVEAWSLGMSFRAAVSCAEEGREGGVCSSVLSGTMRGARSDLSRPLEIRRNGGERWYALETQSYVCSLAKIWILNNDKRWRKAMLHGARPECN